MPDVQVLQTTTMTMLRAALPALGEVLRVFNGGLVDDAGQNTTPPTAANSGGRVMPHWIVYFNAGQSRAADLGGQVLFLPDWGFQLTCVGASPDDVLWAVQLARDTLNGVTPDVAGGARVGFFAEVANAGNVRPDRGIQPNRFYLPLLYGLTAA